MNWDDNDLQISILTNYSGEKPAICMVQLKQCAAHRVHEKGVADHAQPALRRHLLLESFRRQPFRQGVPHTPTRVNIGGLFEVKVQVNAGHLEEVITTWIWHRNETILLIKDESADGRLVECAERGKL